MRWLKKTRCCSLAVKIFASDTRVVYYRFSQFTMTTPLICCCGLLDATKSENILLFQLGELSIEKLLQNTNYCDAANNSAERIDLDNSKSPCGSIFCTEIFGISWFYLEIYTWCTTTLSCCPRFPVHLSTFIEDRKITIVLY